MIATALSIDTPLGITGMVAKDGVQGVWFAWSYAIGGAGAFGAFLFASLLRRSRIITAAELMELRYSGKEAASPRLQGVYFGILATCISMAWTLRSVLVVSNEALGWDAFQSLTLITVITMLYTTASGIWGVARRTSSSSSSPPSQPEPWPTTAVRNPAWARRHRGPRWPTLRCGRDGAGCASSPGGDDLLSHLHRVSHAEVVGQPHGGGDSRIVASKDERTRHLATMLFTVVHFA